MKYRDDIQRDYLSAHARHTSGAMYDDIRSPWPGYAANYGAIVAELAPGARILEVGPGHGSLLAWLRDRGFSNLEGVDASPEDVAFANAHLGGAVVAEGDATAFLRERRERYDAIFAKAVLEHIPMADVLAFVDALAAAVKDDGLVVIDVPNMDWLLSGHERYMDLTHATGYTRESLRALLALRFEQIVVVGSAVAAPTRSQRLLRRPLLALIRRAFYILGEGASDVLFMHRSLIATARRPYRETG